MENGHPGPSGPAAHGPVGQPSSPGSAGAVTHPLPMGAGSVWGQRGMRSIVWETHPAQVSSVPMATSEIPQIHRGN